MSLSVKPCVFLFSLLLLGCKQQELRDGEVSQVSLEPAASQNIESAAIAQEFQLFVYEGGVAPGVKVRPGYFIRLDQ